MLSHNIIGSVQTPVFLLVSNGLTTNPRILISSTQRQPTFAAIYGTTQQRIIPQPMAPIQSVARLMPSQEYSNNHNTPNTSTTVVNNTIAAMPPPPILHPPLLHANANSNATISLPALPFFDLSNTQSNNRRHSVAQSVSEVCQPHHSNEAESSIVLSPLSSAEPTMSQPTHEDSIEMKYGYSIPPILTAQQSVLPPIISATSIPAQSHSSEHLHIDDSKNNEKEQPSVIETTPPTSDATNNRTHVCNICGKAYSTEGTLKQHSILHTDTALKCDICGMKFVQFKKLQTHRNRHFGIKPFKCELVGCNATFADKCSLKRHCRIHSGEKPFQCPHCSQKFHDSGKRSLHIRRKHSPPLERLFKCSEVGCNSTFTNRYDLRQHAMVHSDDRPFKCHICGTTVKRKGDMKRHIRDQHTSL